MDYFTLLVSEFGKNGIVLDTNIFVLHLVGSLNPELLPKIKRTAQFDLDDFKRLQNLLSLTNIIIVTPGIVTETCNLLESSNQFFDFQLFEILRNVLKSTREDYVAADTLTNHPLFNRFGFADSSVADLAERGILILTDDIDLQVALESNSLQKPPWSKR